MLTLTGQVLAGKYRVGARLGGGGMGEVYEAVQEGLGRRVAIKVMSGPMASDPQLLERFQREARAVAALGHPHIVQVTDFQDNPGEPPFLVMERLIGESLGELLERQPMVEPMRACRIAEQTLSALSAAHETGLVHRDVKPDNIFLCKSDTGSEIVKLLDFGVAKAMEETQHGKLTSTGAIVGTLVYMAPEQARGEAIDARADVYALGACLYHMLGGQPPFNAPNAARLLSMVCSEPVPALGALRPDLDPNLVAIVMRAMAHYAQQRYPSARAMMSALGAFLRGEAPTTDPMSATALASSDGFRTGPASPPYGMAPPSTGPQHYIVQTPTPGTPPPMYMHPGSGGGVVVPPYAIAPSAPPPRSGGKILFGIGLATLALGGTFGGAMWWMTKHPKAPIVATTVTPPPAVSLVSATQNGQSGDLTTLSPIDSAAQLLAPPPIRTNATTINAPPVTTATNPALSGMTTAQLAGELTRAHQRGDGKACLDAYDKLRAQPDFSDPANGYAVLHGDCLMEAGRCDEGRRIIRDYYNQPRPIMQQMTPQQIDQMVSSMAQMYCPPSQLAAPERAQRAQTLLYRAQSSKDTAGAARYADEIATQLPALPRATEEERHKVASYEYGIGKAYGDVGRCADATKHFRSQCGLNGNSNPDMCASSLLRTTSGCKP
ncbi:MAG TPA: protein kinase [Polyangiaceae bacterium]